MADAVAAGDGAEEIADRAGQAEGAGESEEIDPAGPEAAAAEGNAPGETAPEPEAALDDAVSGGSAAEEPAPEPEAAAAEGNAPGGTAPGPEAALDGTVPRGSAPEEPAPADRPALSIAGRRIDRRSALVAGGVVVVGGAVLALASSGGSGSTPAASPTGPAGVGKGAGATGHASTAPSVPLPTITTSPADGATGVDPSKPVIVKVLNGTIASVQLSGQEQTNGTLSADGSSWTSANALNVDSSYQLTVTAMNSAGKTKTATVSFHTLHPSATFGVSSVVPPRGSTVGVGQPIRVTFSNYVPTEYHAALEQACVVMTDPPVAGAWYWVSNSGDGAVLDWRPQDFWPVNTKVSVNFNLNGVRLGQHQFGVKDYSPHEFSIRGTDLRLIVDKDRFTATCYENGKVIRTFPIDTGQTTAETFVTYTGTMAVLGKGNPVEMKGNYGPNDTYDDFVNWATQITWSGTYVHAAPWDPEIGHANDDSHGCVHCRTVDAEWFYGIVQPGDVVTINGSRKRPVAVSNGICTFTLDWPTLLKGSAYGATLNGKPVTA
jgi:lipoprotein-anchoring transpeptidase ErfK/SrfK